MNHGKTMLPCLVAALLVGCAPRQDASAPAVEARKMVLSHAERDAAPQASAEAATAAPVSFLAYEHQLTLDVPDAQVATQHARLLKLCAEVAQGGCTLLESRLDVTSERAQGTVRMRVGQAAVKPLLAQMSHLGAVASQATTVEDLAQPMADADKRVAMLTAYRTQLEALRAKSSQDIETAMKIAKEWTQVQTELEAVTGERAFLLKRVQTELVTISLQSIQTRPVAEPVREAVVAFGTHVAEAVAGLITALAYGLPWGLGLVVLGAGGRQLWRRQRSSRTPLPEVQSAPAVGNSNPS